MRITRVDAVQAHPVPKQAHAPRGPFPPELFREEPIVYAYEPALNEDGSNLPVGSTAQNNFSEIKWLYCGLCYEKVKSNETEEHECEE